MHFEEQMQSVLNTVFQSAFEQSVNVLKNRYVFFDVVCNIFEDRNEG